MITLMNAPLKRRSTTTLHGSVSQKTLIFNIKIFLNETGLEDVDRNELFSGSGPVDKSVNLQVAKDGFSFLLFDPLAAYQYLLCCMELTYNYNNFTHFYSLMFIKITVFFNYVMDGNMDRLYSS
jgi:hypothetical protein